MANITELRSLSGWKATLAILQREGHGHTGAAAECRREIRLALGDLRRAREARRSGK